MRHVLLKRLAPGALLAVLAFGALGCGKTVGDTIDDATITTRVKTALLNDSQVAGLKIDVDTFKGVVTLSGAVKTRGEEQRAIQIARSVDGVTNVKSTLQINPADD
jgi:osmotically-inducible protein OsmY